MTDNEKLYLWQHNGQVAPWDLKNAPDYPNDAAACDSLLDTLVENGYECYIENYGKDAWKCGFLRSQKNGKHNYSEWEAFIKHTRREAIIAACLEVARKELEV